MSALGPWRSALVSVVGEGLRAYRRDWRWIIGASTLVLVPITALATGADAVLEDAVGNGDYPKIVLALAAVALAAVGYYFLKGVLTHLVISRRGGGEPPGLFGLFRRLPYGRMIATDVLLAGTIGLGLELLIVPGLLAGTWFGLAPVIVEVEGSGPIASMRRSRELVRGSFLLVASVLFLTIVGVALISIPLKELAALPLPGDAGSPLEEAVGLLVAGILVKPLGALTAVELTLDLIDAEG